MAIRTFVYALAASLASAAVIPDHSIQKRSPYPFSQLVAFGDELSDNGNGSYAANITGSPRNVYGFGTWTNGPVAVSYLADMLNVPLVDYAFGGCCGGGTYGAVVNNTWGGTPAMVDWVDGPRKGTTTPVPSVWEQIHLNYTKQPNNNIQNSMHFIWVGQNDVSNHTDTFWQGDPHNADFAKGYASRITADAEYLVQQGAPYVFIANIYPKNLAPATKTYLCPDGSCVDTWGAIIKQANDALKASLAASPQAKKFIYYDVNNFLTQVLRTKDAWGLTAAADAFCDGGYGQQWDTCIAGGTVWDGAKKFFWMNYIQPTTTVHQMIALDMRTRIDMYFAGH